MTEIEAESPETPSEETKGAFNFEALVNVVVWGAILMVVAVVGSVALGFFRPTNRITACKSNLKNIGTAMEMYSTDWSGKYPTNGMISLTPNYLKTIPECPQGGPGTYTMEMGKSATYNTQSYEDYYFVYCKGDAHAPISVPANYPQYDGIRGLIER